MEEELDVLSETPTEMSILPLLEVLELPIAMEPDVPEATLVLVTFKEPLFSPLAALFMCISPLNVEKDLPLTTLTTPPIDEIESPPKISIFDLLLSLSPPVTRNTAP